MTLNALSCTVNASPSLMPLIVAEPFATLTVKPSPAVAAIVPSVEAVTSEPFANVTVPVVSVEVVPSFSRVSAVVPT